MGAGVAALLEIALILSESEPLRDPVILLFTDGEEDYDMGARDRRSDQPGGARYRRLEPDLRDRPPTMPG